MNLLPMMFEYIIKALPLFALAFCTQTNHDNLPPVPLISRYKSVGLLNMLNYTQGGQIV